MSGKMIGVVLGVVLLGVGVISVAFMDWNPEVEPQPQLVRPLKTLVIASPFIGTGRKYPGKVRANQEVDLAFQVTGALIEILVKKGEDVTQGKLIARLDPRDFENDLASKRATREQAQFNLEKVKRLIKSGAASPQEVSDNQAAFDIAESEVKTAEKALDDTYMRAPFAGVIANRFVENFENVLAKQSIISLQDVTSVEIEVNVPEDVVALRKKDSTTAKFFATFDYLPDRKFNVELKEFSTEADPATQTYAVRMVMPAPEDISILPGMTATIQPYQTLDKDSSSSSYAVPLDAVPADGLGNYFVWKVSEEGDGTGTVSRVDVKVGEMVQDSILVLEGLQQGDRIAAAGVHMLQEGQKIRLLSPQEEDSSS